MVIPAFVVLSDHDADMPALPGVCTVSKDRQKAGWDHGAYDIGIARATAGAFWIDRPYRPGAFDPLWMVSNCRAITAAGGWCQAGNEPRQEWPGGVRPYLSTMADCLRTYPEGNWVLAPLGDPLSVAWDADLNDPGYRALGAVIGRVACHAYGNVGQMIAAVRRYLDTFPTAEIVITECNPGAGQTFDLGRWAISDLRPFLDWCATQPRVRMVAYFAYRWPQPDMPLPTSVDGAGTAIEAVLRTWTPPQPKEPLVIRGIDVSNNQGPAIDWAQVAASGVAFAAIKASGDETASGRFVDPYFVRNWHAAGQREIVRIAYHYGCPSQVSAAQSVALLAEQIVAAGGLKPGDLVALDLEDPAVPVGTTLVSWTADWLTRAEATFGVVPMLYTGNYYLVEHGMLADGGLGQTVRLGRYPLWLASYQPTKPPPPAGWDHITIWQHASDGRVPGIAGDCDLNQFDGTTADLRALGLPDPSAPRTKESSMIQLNDADKAAIQAANDATWAAAETYQRVLAGYGARGASLGEWNSQIAKGAVVNIKAACGLQAA